jgi:chorismate dehydratase
VNVHQSFYKRLSAKFVQRPIKIPNYILNTYAKERGISAYDIKEYLKLISYSIKKKEQKALFIFLKKAKRLKKSPS